MKALAHAPLPFVQAVLGLASVGLYSRLFDAEEFGAYALLLSATLLAHTLLFTWIEGCAYRFQPRDGEAGADTHFATLRDAGVMALAGAALATAAATIFFPAMAAPILCAGAALALRFVSRIAREGERAAGRAWRFTLREAGYHAASLPLGIALVWSTDLGLAAPFLAMACASALFAIEDGAALLRAAGRTPFDLARLRPYLAYGAPLALALGFDLINQTALRAMTMQAASAGEAGALAAAQSLARPIDLLCAAVGLGYGPMLLRAVGDRARMGRLRLVAAATTLALSGAAVLVLILAGPLVTGLALGEGVRVRAAEVLTWTALAAMLNGLALHVLGESLVVARRTGARAACLAGASLVQLSAGALLTPILGAAGAAIAACLGALCACIFLMAAMGRGAIGATIAPDLGDPDAARA
jgi:O-antigen/teichoic acid export membrane protein